MRFFTALLTRLLERFGPHDLDPTRVARVLHEFDERRGYAAYLASCRAVATRSFDPDLSAVLEQRGFERIELMDRAAATALVATLEKRFPSSALMRRSYLDCFDIHDRLFTEELLAALLPPAVDARIAAYFQAEYLVHWFTVIRTLPAPVRHDPSFLRSYLWHCDRGPSWHLKLLVYLNDHAEHGGGTDFLDLNTSRRFAANGYIFGKPRYRKSDLSRLAKRTDVVLDIHHCKMAPGQAVLFQPARVLHRGVMPTRGSRYVATLCLLPSPVSWVEALRAGTLSTLGEDSKWHADARDLLRRLSEARSA